MKSEVKIINLKYPNLTFPLLAKSKVTGELGKL